MASTRTAAIDARKLIVAATADLLAEGGRDAVSTRAVSAAAGVQAPTIYRLFGDKQGLLDAVATDGFTRYLESKTDLEPSGDPVEDLRRGWDLHVRFGLGSPGLYSLIYGDPRSGAASPAAEAVADVLATHIRNIAKVGRLRVSEKRATELVHSAGCGTTLTLITLPEDQRDLALSEIAREAVIAAITTDAPTSPEPGAVATAAALRAVLPQVSTLTPAEQDLLREWLDRIIEPAR